MKREKLLKDIQDVFDNGKLRPVKNTFRVEGENCGCGLTAGFIACGYAIDDYSHSVSDVVKKNYDLTDDYMFGFTRGFDGVASSYSGDEQVGYEDGLMLSNKYFGNK